MTMWLRVDLWPIQGKTSPFYVDSSLSSISIPLVSRSITGGFDNSITGFSILSRHPGQPSRQDVPAKTKSGSSVRYGDGTDQELSAKLSRCRKHLTGPISRTWMDRTLAFMQISPCGAHFLVRVWGRSGRQSILRTSNTVVSTEIRTSLRIPEATGRRWGLLDRRRSRQYPRFGWVLKGITRGDASWQMGEHPGSYSGRRKQVPRATSVMNSNVENWLARAYVDTTWLGIDLRLS
ncbi:hypothetical protein F4802DRAFT_468990 [Xylaria palmicola]|nr:hypothetical protein F4802DRAFT_468990 [Xylaria palmicola]